MLFRMLKKDLKRKKVMNAILLCFILLATMFVASGISNVVSVMNGTDSYLGTLASILMSCSETIFYTVSVYYVTAKVTKTRWTLPGALIATFAGIVSSVLILEIFK